jgi:hypothetical protein
MLASNEYCVLNVHERIPGAFGTVNAPTSSLETSFPTAHGRSGKETAALRKTILFHESTKL